MTVETNEKSSETSEQDTGSKAEAAEEQESESPEETSEPEGDGTPPRRRWSLGDADGAGRSRLLQLAVLIALAASIATAVLQWQRANTLDAENATEQRVRTRAGEFGKALLSYDHTNLKAARERVMSLSTGDFSKFYDVDFAGALGPLITRLKATAKASVRDVYLTEVDGSRAKAIVVMDSETTTTSGTRRVLGSYLDLEVLKVKGEWRVNAVSSVGTINESLTKPDGTPVDPDATKPPKKP